MALQLQSLQPETTSADPALTTDIVIKITGIILGADIQLPGALSVDIGDLPANATAEVRFIVTSNVPVSSSAPGRVWCISMPASKLRLDCCWCWLSRSCPQAPATPWQTGLHTAEGFRRHAAGHVPRHQRDILLDQPPERSVAVQHCCRDDQRPRARRVPDRSVIAACGMVVTYFRGSGTSRQQVSEPCVHAICQLAGVIHHETRAALYACRAAFCCLVQPLSCPVPSARLDTVS